MTLAAPEALAKGIKARHKLSSLHIFDNEDGWRVFGFRASPKGFQASVETGDGETIHEALRNLDARLAEGPIHRAGDA